jgi:molybdenum cofactor synthesis domain-containing protein
MPISTLSSTEKMPAVTAVIDAVTGMTENKVVTASLVIIGNEILSGRTQDANLTYLATSLNDIGIRMMEVRIVPDIEAEIVRAVNECRAAYDYVFTTGGIGPTHDDITAASISAAFGVPVIRHPDAVKMLATQYPGDKLNEARLKMADTPEGASLLDNPVSRAPGIQMENVWVLPGVPFILKGIFDNNKHKLLGGKPMLSKTISAYTVEGAIAAPLNEIQDAHPETEIGSYPLRRDGRMGLSLVIRSVDQAPIDAAAEKIRTMLRGVGEEPLEDGF